MALEKSLHVAKTVDMWTYHRRSFLGMTVYTGSEVIYNKAVSV